MFTTYSCILNSLTVKPPLEKHLPEEADSAGMQRLLQIGKLKICGPPFHVSILKGYEFEFWRAPFGKTFFHICSH